MNTATLTTRATRPTHAHARAFNEAFERIFALEAANTVEVLLIRHAEPDYDAPMNGEFFDLPLGKCGRWQAMRLATSLRTSEIDAIYTSTMRQAVETSAVLAAAKDLPMMHTPELRDIDVDLTWCRGPLSDPQRFASEVAARYLTIPRWDATPGCEPSRQFRHRVIQTIERIAAENPGRRVAIVTHASVINAYLSMVCDIGRDMFFMPAYTSVSAVRVADRYAIQSINDVSHLSRNVRSNQEE